VINREKSQIIHFRSPKKRVTERVFKVGQHNLNIVKSYKYLGVMLDEHLKFDLNLEIMSSSAHRALGSVIYKYKSHRAITNKHIKKCLIAASYLYWTIVVLFRHIQTHIKPSKSRTEQ
jgi:hypothetical protein